MKPDTH